MRPTHRAGEQRLVDDAGPRIPVVNRPRGEGHEAVMVVAVLGASSDPSAEATWPQRRSDGIGSHGRTWAALGGVPESVVPDPLQAAVPRAHRDAPASHRTSPALAPPEGCAGIPARAATPREKAKVAGGGPVVERWRLARRRPHPGFALAAVKAARLPLLSTLHARPFKNRPGARQERFDTRERPALRPLPAPP
jgi:transposase